MKQKALDGLNRCLESENDRIFLKAQDALRAMEAQNQKDELAKLTELRDQIIEFANRLGIQPPGQGTVEASEGEAGGSLPAIGESDGEED